MIEKAGQAVKAVKTVFPYFKIGLHGFRMLRHGKAFLKGHSSKYRLKTYLKQQERKQKKIQKQYYRREIQEKFSLVFNKERLLLKTALMLRKRYF